MWYREVSPNVKLSEILKHFPNILARILWRTLQVHLCTAVLITYWNYGTTTTGSSDKDLDKQPDLALPNRLFIYLFTILHSFSIGQSILWFLHTSVSRLEYLKKGMSFRNHFKTRILWDKGHIFVLFLRAEKWETQGGWTVLFRVLSVAVKGLGLISPMLHYYFILSLSLPQGGLMHSLPLSFVGQNCSLENGIWWKLSKGAQERHFQETEIEESQEPVFGLHGEMHLM